MLKYLNVSELMIQIYYNEIIKMKLKTNFKLQFILLFYHKSILEYSNCISKYCIQ